MEPIGTQINVRLKTVHNGENYYLSVGDVNGVRLGICVNWYPVPSQNRTLVISVNGLVVFVVVLKI